MSSGTNNNNNNNAALMINPPDGWRLRNDLTEDDMIKLLNMRNFLQHAVSAVAAMRTGLTIFQQNQVFLSRFQQPHRNVVVNHALQEIMTTTSMHWHYVTIVYAEYLRLGFCPPSKTAGDASSSSSSPSTTTSIAPAPPPPAKKAAKATANHHVL
ncbi:unnamed protein product [Cylindrotheca closterium]|uniref:Uncharacterized protein n=1 Tax=Cylindrotheca closterium TaxID=2856 RepID=A0AAD2CQ36_9STRA|nr:unnamed protein product [Cylindrotheca closterium]